jgi:hypothetical protein
MQVRVKGMLAVAAALILALTAATGCSPQKTEAELEFDDALHEVEEAVGGFYLLGAEATPEQIRTEMTRLSSAWEDLTAVAPAVEGVDLLTTTVAHEALAAEVDALPGGSEDGDAMTRILPLVQAFEAELETIHTTGAFH